MRSFLIAVVALLDGQTARAQDVRVDQFQLICLEARSSYAASLAASERLGWAPVEEAVRPELAHAFAVARTANTPATPMSQLRAFHYAALDLFLVLTELQVQGRLVNGCYLYDYAAVEPLADEVFTTIVGVAPNEVTNRTGVVMMQKWIGPASLPNVATLRVGFFPEGSPLVTESGFSGLVLAVTSLSAP